MIIGQAGVRSDFFRECGVFDFSVKLVEGQRLKE
jgi:hypothetical protein